MKILFYDIDNFELEYFLKNSINFVEPYFFKIPLNPNTYIDARNKDAESLSVFVQSDLTKEVLRQFENLKFIFLRSTGYSNVDLNYCKEKNIKVFNVPNYGTNSVAEFVFALALNVSRKILKANYELKDGIIEKEALVGVELNSKTMGVIGLGAIGKRVYEIASGFKMNVLAYDVAKTGEYNYTTLDNLLKNSDFIAITCPLTNSTKYMINHNSFLKMKKNSILINVSRGEIIETESLYDAIVNKKILSCALDVVECEQTLCKLFEKCSKKDNIKSHCAKKYLFNSKLIQMENVIITPHIAYSTIEAKEKIVKITTENIKSSLDINYGTKNLILI